MFGTFLGLLFSCCENLATFSVHILLGDLVEDPSSQALLLLLGQVEGAVFQSPLEGEDVDVGGPLVGGDYHHLGLFVESKQEGESVYVAQRSDGVCHWHQSSERHQSQQECDSSEEDHHESLDIEQNWGQNPNFHLRID